MEPNIIVNNEFEWPEFPYKGLSYYESKDFPIFGGRENDLYDFAEIFVNPSNKMVILHGVTGCGKSSFLRAGLIPFIEKAKPRFQFLKEDEDSSDKTLFIRSTGAPLFALSEILFGFISMEHKLTTPVGVKTLNLSNAFLEYTQEREFIEKVGGDPEKIISVLEAIYEVLPTKLVFIIDQAEEVLTLKPREEDDKDRRLFFEFLSLFNESGINFKILIAIRTEFYGRFRGEMPPWVSNTVPEFLLKELDKKNLIEAIKYPTSEDSYRNHGASRDNYKFYYEDGLPEKIAQELKKVTLLGGLLPVMQIVCKRLYNLTKKKSQEGKNRVIREEDYKKLGCIEKQVQAYLEEVLRECCRLNGIDPVLAGSVNPAGGLDLAIQAEKDKLESEVSGWENVLSKLVKTQADGTVTTDIKTQKELNKIATDSNCRLDFETVMKFLSDEQQRIIQERKVINVNTEAEVSCFSLGHDAIGLALKDYIAIEKYKEIKISLNYFTILGFIAVVLWSTTVAIGRSITESIGSATTVCCIYILGGCISMTLYILRKKQLPRFGSFPMNYLLGCGALFVVYMASLYLAIGKSADHMQVIEVGLVNHLWPVLTLALSVTILGYRANGWLYGGIFCGAAGIILVTTQETEVSVYNFLHSISKNPIAYGLAMVASVSWALYSNLSRRWGSKVDGGAIPLFMLVTGIVLFFWRALIGESSTWSVKVVTEIFFLSLSSALAYVFWDMGIRRGNFRLIAAFSYLTPLLSAFAVCIYLGVFPGVKLWTGCVLIITGAYISKISVSDVQEIKSK